MHLNFMAILFSNTDTSKNDLFESVVRRRVVLETRTGGHRPSGAGSPAVLRPPMALMQG